MFTVRNHGPKKGYSIYVDDKLLQRVDTREVAYLLKNNLDKIWVDLKGYYKAGNLTSSVYRRL